MMEARAHIVLVISPSQYPFANNRHAFTTLGGQNLPLAKGGARRGGFAGGVLAARQKERAPEAP
jgi:hypothetical protein